MMKKFIRFMATAAAMIVSALSMTAAEPVTFVSHDMDISNTSALTTALWSDASFVTTTEYKDNENEIKSCKYALFSEKAEKIHVFSINIPENCTPEPIRIISSYQGLGSSSAYRGEIMATQYLFNDDDLYEVVLEKGEREPYVYVVYNEKGEFLGECPGTELYLGKNEILFYGKYDRYVLYNINRKTGSKFSEVRDVPQGLRSIPNPVGEDETVTVLLPEGLSAGAAVQVYSLNGSLLVRRECAPGETSVEIPASALSAGVNPVIVVDADGNVVASGKIVRE